LEFPNASPGRKTATGLVRVCFSGRHLPEWFVPEWIASTDR
jgi:hypothetical protein